MNIDEYITGLRGALAGADPALVQDAVYDAEEYLHSEMAGCEGDVETCFAEIVERYGTPEEVAAAYLETEVTVARALIDLLPDEDLVYLGDTGRYPYGPRELSEVAGFAHQITEELVERRYRRYLSYGHYVN